MSNPEKVKNNVKRLREERLLSKAELARKAGVSPLTIDRVESGMPCRMDTKRKIILALGMTIEEKDKVFERSAADDGGDDGKPGQPAQPGRPGERAQPGQPGQHGPREQLERSEEQTEWPRER